MTKIDTAPNPLALGTDALVYGAELCLPGVGSVSGTDAARAYGDALEHSGQYGADDLPGPDAHALVGTELRPVGLFESDA